MDCMEACVKKGAVTDRRKHAALVRRVAVLLAAGKRQKEIAAELGVTPARARMAVWSKELEPEDLRRMREVQEYRVRLWKHRRGMKR